MGEKINLKCSKVIGDAIRDCNWDDYDFEAIDTIKVDGFEYNKPKYGTWLEVDRAPWGSKYATCSCCGTKQTIEFDNYCPVCGAKMSL